MKQTLEFPLAPFTLSITVISERNVSNKTELLLTALRFSFKFLGKFHVVSSTFHVWLAVHHPMMPLTQFQKILM